MADYVNGSDVLLLVGGKAIGHCTTNSIDHKAESKDRAVKPPLTATSGKAGLWKTKTITGLSETISGEGLVFDDEAECGYKDLLAMMDAGAEIECKYCTRGEEATKYRGGKYVITSLQQTNPAGDDSTYSISLESSGEIKTFPVS